MKKEKRPSIFSNLHFFCKYVRKADCTGIDSDINLCPFIDDSTHGGCMLKGELHLWDLNLIQRVLIEEGFEL